MNSPTGPPTGAGKSDLNAGVEEVHWRITAIKQRDHDWIVQLSRIGEPLRQGKEWRGYTIKINGDQKMIYG